MSMGRAATVIVAVILVFGGSCVVWANWPQSDDLLPVQLVVGADARKIDADDRLDMVAEDDDDDTRGAGISDSGTSDSDIYTSVG